jgi:hypothetical protein
VPEDCSIFKTSLCSVERALERVELVDEELLELVVPLLLFEVLVEAAAVAVVPVVDVEDDVSAWCACSRAATWCATWPCAGVIRPSSVSHERMTFRARLGRECPTPTGSRPIKRSANDRSCIS